MAGCRWTTSTCSPTPTAPPATTPFARDEAMLVEQCATAALRPSRAGGRLLEAARRRRQRRRRRATACRHAPEIHASTILDGVVRLDGHLDPLGGATFLAELERLTRQRTSPTKPPASCEPAAQRRAAALVEMATRSASTPSDARRPAPLFTVVIGDDSFAHLCELATGTIINPGQLVPYLDTAEVETVLFGDPLTVVGVSPQRTFNGRLRRAIASPQPALRTPLRLRRPHHPTATSTTSHQLTAATAWRLKRTPRSAGPATGPETRPGHDPLPLPERRSPPWTASRASLAPRARTPRRTPGSATTTPENPQAAGGRRRR